MTPTIRLLAEGDLAEAVALQRECFPAPFPEELLWHPEHLERHLAVFPEGQFAAIMDGRVVATASSTRIRTDRWQAHEDWDATVGGPFLRTFAPDGEVLYGLDISVHPRFRGQGLARALYEARFDLVRSLGMVRYATACRIPDYHLHSSALTPEAYVELVAKGGLVDRTLTPLLRLGLTLVGVCREHMQDWESRNAAALLEWTP